MLKRICILSSLIIMVLTVSGCGETVNGVVKDSRRIGSGVHKIFVRDGS